VNREAAEKRQVYRNSDRKGGGLACSKVIWGGFRRLRECGSILIDSSSRQKQTHPCIWKICSWNDGKSRSASVGEKKSTAFSWRSCSPLVLPCWDTGFISNCRTDAVASASSGRRFRCRPSLKRRPGPALRPGGRRFEAYLPLLPFKNPGCPRFDVVAGFFFPDETENFPIAAKKRIAVAFYLR